MATKKIKGFAIVCWDELGYDGYTHFTVDEETAETLLEEAGIDLDQLHIVPATLEFTPRNARKGTRG